MAIHQQRPRASIYLTYKVIQIVHQLRRCLKPRVSSSSTKDSILGSKSCLGLETKALRSIQKGVSHARPIGKKQWYHANRVVKNRASNRTALRVSTPGRHDAANQNTSGDEVQHTLRSLDEVGNIGPPDNALSEVCTDEKKFLESGKLNFDPCSLNETISLLALVVEAIRVLSIARGDFDDQFLIDQGHAIGLNIDEVFIANYEHLLMRLQTELMEALVAKAIETLIGNDLDKRQRKLLLWFTEFPDNRHPLNTTWPWSIKPSLAVLWGVCWMFYGNGRPDQQLPGRQNPRIPQDRILRSNALSWDTPQPNECESVPRPPQEGVCRRNAAANSGFQADLNFGLDLIGTNLQRDGSGIGDGGRGGAALRQNAPDSWMFAGAPTTFGQAPAQPPWSQSDPDLVSPGTGGPGPTPPTRTYYTQAIPPTQPNISNFSLPESSGIATSHNLFVYPQRQLDANSNAWPQYAQRLSNLPQRTTGGHLTVPAIITDDNSENQGFAQPQNDFSFPDLFEQGVQGPQAQHLSNLNPFSNLPYNMGTCAPPDASIAHPAPLVRHERTTSVNSISNIPTPISMADRGSPLLSPTDDRRPSTSNIHVHSHRRQLSEVSVGSVIPSSDDDDSSLSRRNHSYKRAEEPPRNAEGKMYCKHKECVNMIFDRKCEWSKHMDKHDRPYKCTVKGCEKLQGFTYSGGLLRHEREVHKLHGGTKKSLFCPFPNCKRSSGSGFTRKENLAEHVRRVHRRTSTSSDLGNMVISRTETQDDVSEVRLPSESPYRMADLSEEQFTPKRKRMSDAGASESGADETDLRSEVKRLRRENEEKDARLRQLEDAVQMLQRQSFKQ